MRNKKGSSGHIEIVISFLIFISFVIFLFSVFPVYKSGKSEVGLDAAEHGILNFASEDVYYFTVILNLTEQLKEDCFCIYYASQNPGNPIAKNESGNLVNTTFSLADGICINDKEKFHVIYSSYEFKETPVDKSKCKILSKLSGDYLIGLESSTRMIFYDKVVSLTNEYNSNYEKLKGDFGVPKKEDFKFKITDLKGAEILGTAKNTGRVEVLARNIPGQLAYENGSSVFVMLNIQAW